MAEAEVDADELNEAIASVQALGSNIEADYHDLIEEKAGDLEEGIRRWIGKKGLISHDGEGTPLVESFYVRRMGLSSWKVASEAEHAMPLEEGSQRHAITPNEKDLLSWVPENPNDYPTKEAQTPITMLEDGDTASGLTTWYDPEEGRVYSVGVMHPGNRPYEYITTAQANWQGQLGIDLRTEANKILVKSGFSRV